MPLYEYECTQCHRRTEKRQKFSDAEITECPHCGGLLERTITAPAVMFKGGGWYADGYGNKAAAKPDSTTKSEGTPKSDGTTTDSAKPATESTTSTGAGSNTSTEKSTSAPATTTPASTSSNTK